MRPFEMAFPESVEEAADLLAEDPECRPIAGGTALTVVMKEGVYFPDRLVNLRPLADELRYVRETDDAVRVGALATLSDLAGHEAVRESFPTVAACLEEVAGVRVRNSATVGGHLAHADPKLDLPPVLAGLDAEVVLTDGRDDRRLPIESFLVGSYETALEPGELVSALVIPKRDPPVRGVYLKHRYYSAVDWPCVGVAAFGEPAAEGLRAPRLLLSAVSETPALRVEGVADRLDPRLDDASIAAVADLAAEQARPIDDLRGSAEYKRRMVGVFTRRALERLREEVLA